MDLENLSRDLIVIREYLKNLNTDLSTLLFHFNKLEGINPDHLEFPYCLKILKDSFLNIEKILDSIFVILSEYYKNDTLRNLIFSSDYFTLYEDKVFTPGG